MIASAASREFAGGWIDAGWVALSAVIMLASFILFVRVAGLRTLSKMSSFDFVVTVAFGSLVAATVMSSSTVSDGVVGVGTLLAAQAAVAVARRRFGADRITDNRPLLLMDGTEILDDNLDHARVTRSDLVAKLREANVLRWEEVRAVVLETTGDISVLHGDAEIDDGLLDGVRVRA